MKAKAGTAFELPNRMGKRAGVFLTCAFASLALSTTLRAAEVVCDEAMLKKITDGDQIAKFTVIVTNASYVQAMLAIDGKAAEIQSIGELPQELIAAQAYRTGLIAGYHASYTEIEKKVTALKPCIALIQ